jgi:hypothetical protein
LSEALDRFENGVEVIVLHQLDSAILQDFGMYASPMKFRLDRADPCFGFFKSLRCLTPPELSILSILHAGKRKYRIEFLPPGFKLLASPNETSGNQERLYEVDY